jgi:hypothetical protein
MRWCLSCLLLSSCAVPVVDEPWRIERARLLAVVAQPAEVAPGDEVTLAALMAAPEEAEPVSVAWAPCDAPTPFGASTTVSEACWGALAAAPREMERERTFTVPLDACARFGADGSAGARPRDPDATGGWYWPVALGLDESTSFAGVRLTCRPGSVPLEVVQAWRSAWRPNDNPRLEVIASSPLDALTSGQTVELVADWSNTPEESYAVARPGSAQLDFATESYDVSWFVAGDVVLEKARTSGRVQLRVPPTAGTGRVWGVLRDGRGGVSTWTAMLAWR